MVKGRAANIQSSLEHTSQFVYFTYCLVAVGSSFSTEGCVESGYSPGGSKVSLKPIDYGELQGLQALVVGGCR